MINSVHKVAKKNLDAMIIIAEKLEKIIREFDPLDQILKSLKEELEVAKANLESARQN
jgi:hypothetical protein